MKKRVFNFEFLILSLILLLLPISSARAATGCTYPTTLDTFTDVGISEDLTATAYNKLQCAIEKAQAEFGTLPKGTYATVKARLDDAVYLVGNQTLAGVKTFSDVLTSALGAITADKQNLTATATWNAAGVTFTALKLNVTNTASAAASLLIDLQVDSVSKFKVDKSSVVTATTFSGNATSATALAANPADCGANNFAQSIAASGDLTCAAVSLATADTTGTLTIAKGGTGNTTATASFDALSPVTTLGDIIYRDGSNNVRLAGNITSTKKFLRQTGTGAVSAAPAWDTLVSGDLPSHNHAASDINSGLIALARGGLNTDISATGALGDLLYADAATTFARKVGNITTTKKILMQTGTGAVSAAPTWSLIDTAALLDATLCSDTQILKKVSGAWACATDATAGSPTWDSVASPAANQALSMAATTTTWTWSAATGAGTNMLTVKDTDNNTGTGYLVSLNTQAGSAAKPLRVTAAGTANGFEVTTAGGLAAIGSGTITANRTPCTGSDFLKFDGTCAATAASLWSGIGNPTANQSLSMAAYTTIWTWNDVTGAGVNPLTIRDTANNTGTGYLVSINTATGSVAKPLRITATGTANGFEVTTVGGLESIGTGTIKANRTPCTGTDYLKFDGTCAAVGVAPFTDTTAIVKGSVDATKLLRFEVDGFTTGTTRVLTPPNFDGTIATLSGAETFSGVKTFTANPVMSGAGRTISFDNLDGQILMGNVTDPGWTRPAIQLSTRAALFSSLAANIEVATNVFYDGAQKYIETAAASKVMQDSGSVQLYVALSGTAGTAITFSAPTVLNNANRFQIQEAGAPDVELEVSNGVTVGGGTIHRATSATHSEKHLKSDIKYLYDTHHLQAWRDVLALKPVEFRYKTGIFYQENGERKWQVNPDGSQVLVDNPSGLLRRGYIYEDSPDSIKQKRADGSKIGAITIDDRLINIEMALQYFGSALRIGAPNSAGPGYRTLRITNEWVDQ